MWGSTESPTGGIQFESREERTSRLVVFEPSHLDHALGRSGGSPTLRIWARGCLIKDAAVRCGVSVALKGSCRLAL